MPHHIQDLEIHAGNDLVLPVTVTADGTSAGERVDLTGTTKIVWAVSRRDVDGFIRLITKELGDGITLTDSGEGVFEITLSASETLNLHGPYLHEARVTDADGHKSTVLSGNLTVHKTILTVNE